MIRTFAWPALLAAATVAGLIIGLLEDGLFDLVGTVLLVAPTAVGAERLLHALRERRGPGRSGPDRGV